MFVLLSGNVFNTKNSEELVVEFVMNTKISHFPRKWYDDDCEYRNNIEELCEYKIDRIPIGLKYIYNVDIKSAHRSFKIVFQKGIFILRIIIFKIYKIYNS